MLNSRFRILTPSPWWVASAGGQCRVITLGAGRRTEPRLTPARTSLSSAEPLSLRCPYMMGVLTFRATSSASQLTPTPLSGRFGLSVVSLRSHSNLRPPQAPAQTHTASKPTALLCAGGGLCMVIAVLGPPRKVRPRASLPPGQPLSSLLAPRCGLRQHLTGTPLPPATPPVLLPAFVGRRGKHSSKAGLMPKP